MTNANSKLQLIRLAEVQMNLGNPRGAIEPLRRVLAEDPSHALAHAYLGMCQQNTGQPATARNSIETALRLAPEHGFVSYAAGFVALLQKNFGETQDQLARARRLMPAHAETYRVLALVYSRTRQYQRILPTLQDGLSHDPANVGLIADLGMHWLSAGKLAEAEEQARRALAINPECVEAHVLLGYVRLRQRNAAGARVCALTALTCDANDASAVQLMSTIELQTNPLVGIWWRLAVWLGRLHSDMPMASWISLLLGPFLYLGVMAMFGAGLYWQASSVIACVILWFSGLLLAKVFFKRALRRELRNLQLRRGF
jgi:Tfp pilus assembly protein PilF